MTTITATEAYEAMLAHHKALGERLAGRAGAVSGAVAAGQPHEAAVAGLIACLAEEILPHAAAEETTIYPAAAQAGLAGVVGEMTAEHRTLMAAGERLAALADGAAAAQQAQQIAGLFTAHAAKENDLLLPALLATVPWTWPHCSAACTTVPGMTRPPPQSGHGATYPREFDRTLRGHSTRNCDQTPEEAGVTGPAARPSRRPGSLAPLSCLGGQRPESARSPRASAPTAGPPWPAAPRSGSSWRACSGA